MLSCLIVDDSETGIAILKKKLQDNFKNIETVLHCCSIKEAREILNGTSIDLVFLDIKLNNESGFDLLNYFPERDFEIIFVTAHDEFALKAIQEKALYYIVKPIDDKELAKGVSLMVNRLLDTKKNTEQSIMIQSDSSSTRVYYSDILYIQADGAYSHIHLLNKKLVTSKNIGHYEGLLPESIFMRTHNSYIVNVKHVKQIIKSRSPELLLTNDAIIPVSQRKASAINQKVSKG